MQRSFETKEGEKRTMMEMVVEEIGASLKYATAKVNKVSRNGGEPHTPSGDPWGTAPELAGVGAGDAPPF